MALVFATAAQLEPGTQVVYVPEPLGIIDVGPHKCEEGYVERVNDFLAAVRYFRCGSSDLRTLSTPEYTPIERLVVRQHRDPEVIEAWQKKLAVYSAFREGE